MSTTVTADDVIRAVNGVGQWFGVPSASPYNIGKEYEKVIGINEYLNQQEEIIKECIRVFRVTRKPGTDEFKTIVKVSAIGILIIGLLGFIINMIWQMIR